MDHQPMDIDDDTYQYINMDSYNQIECIIYENSSGIFNFDNKIKKYRPNYGERFIVIYFSLENVYENKKIDKYLIYLANKYTKLPIVNVCFASVASANRFIKNNKEYLLNHFGQLNIHYYLESVLFSHYDYRSV